MQTITFLYVGGGILLMALAIPMIRRRIPPNPFYGFRVPAALQDPAVWYAVNRYAGLRLFVTGILSAIAALVFARSPGIPLDNYAWGLPGYGCAGAGHYARAELCLLAMAALERWRV